MVVSTVAAHSSVQGGARELHWPVVVAEARVGGGHQEAGGGPIIRSGLPAREQLLPEPGDLQVTAEAGLGTTHHTVSLSVLSTRC